MHHHWKRVAGALGVLALMASAGVASTHGGVRLALAALFLLVGVPTLIMALADAWGSPLREPAPLVPSGPPPDHFQFEFTSRVADLLDAQEASFEQRIGIRRWIRWGPIALGWMFLGVSLASLDSERVVPAQHVVWWAIGGFLVYCFQVKPWRERRAIRRHAQEESPTTLRFDGLGIHAEGKEGRAVERPWIDLLDYGVHRRGLHFTFELGLSTWMPNRVFRDAQERQDLLQAIGHWRDRARQEEARQQAIRERAWGLTEAEFWRLIDLLDPGLGLENAAALEALVGALAEREVEEIKGFQDILAEHLFRLDSQAHLEAMGQGPATSATGAAMEEAYLGARCLVVASGPQVTRALQRFPEAMPTDRSFPALAQAAALAYEKKCGKPFRFEPMKSIAMGSNPEGWPEDGAPGEDRGEG